MTRRQAEQIESLQLQLQQTERERTELAVVLDSVREIVALGWRYRGTPCPFCQHVNRHGSACYLNAGAGAQILGEYAEIERQRDLLLARLKRLTGTGEQPVRRSLKARLRSSSHPTTSPS